ncbi:hypothetical protein TELCIR_17970, partial [Teladorsagia circumcincta]
PYSSSYAAAHGSLLRPSKTMIDVLAPMRPNAADGTGANLPSTASSSAIVRPTVEDITLNELAHHGGGVQATKLGECYRIREKYEGFRPEDAIQTFGTKLLPYEQSEIFNYVRVFFVGSQAKKRGGVI